jgi:hypothetical protein
MASRRSSPDVILIERSGSEFECRFASSLVVVKLSFGEADLEYTAL